MSSSRWTHSDSMLRRSPSERRWAPRSGRCELLSVAPLGARTELINAHLARAAHLCGTGDVQGVVVQSDDPSTAIIEHVGDDRLLVIGCGATHPMAVAQTWATSGAAFSGRQANRYSSSDPGCRPRSTPRPAHRVCGRGPTAAPRRDRGRTLAGQFRQHRHVGHPSRPDQHRCRSLGARTAEHWTEMLRHNDVSAQVRILHGGDPTQWLNDFVAQLPNGVYVASSSRYTDRRRHLHSTTRDLIRRSRHPVLVVPIRAQEAAQVARRMSES